MHVEWTLGLHHQPFVSEGLHVVASLTTPSAVQSRAGHDHSQWNAGPTEKFCNTCLPHNSSCLVTAWRTEPGGRQPISPSSYELTGGFDGDKTLFSQELERVRNCEVERGGGPVRSCAPGKGEILVLVTAPSSQIRKTDHSKTLEQSHLSDRMLPEFKGPVQLRRYTTSCS